MEDDEEMLKFRASASDLLRGESEEKVGLRNLKHYSIHMKYSSLTDHAHFRSLAGSA